MLTRCSVYILLLFFSSTCLSKVTIQKTVEIYKQLIIKNKIKYHPDLEISYEDDTNAFYNKKENSITITKLLLDIADEDTIAWTLGHELTHAKYKHTTESWMSKHALYKQEYLADRGGKKLAESLGYSACKGFKWLYDMHYTGSPDHPDSDKRWGALGCKNN